MGDSQTHSEHRFPAPWDWEFGSSAWSLAASMKGAELGPAKVKVSLLPASCTSCSHVHDDAILSQASRRTVTNTE